MFAPRLSAPRVVLLAGLVLAAGACAPPPPPRHVIFVTVDTLRADHLSLYGYERATSPRLDEIAQDALVFDHAIAQWPKTGTSFASIFTGQYPQTTGLTHRAAVRVPEEYLTLPELFKANGFTTVAVVSNAVLGDHLGWNTGFDEYHETWERAAEQSEDPVEYRRYINAGIVNEIALPLLERHREAEHLFAWIHYSDPHAPYILPEGVSNPFLDDVYYTGDEKVDLHDERATALGERRDLKYYVAQYDANIRYTDEHLGKLWDHLDAIGIRDDALVIVSADHGESLGEHGYFFGHGRLPYNDGVRVPLLLSHRSLEARRVKAPVELVDLYPTLQTWIAPERPVPGLEGRNLLARAAGEAKNDDASTLSPRGDQGGKTLAFSQAGGGSPLTHFRSVQDGDWKLIYHPAFQHKQREFSARFELYHLEADPLETEDLAADPNHPDLRRLSGELRGWMKGSEWIRKPRSEVLTHNEETLKALRALGYVE